MTTFLSVLCPNAHRVKISITPGKLLQEILFEACMREGYDQNTYGLQFQRKFLDLSLPIRLLGLPNNATLEMIKRESFINEAATVQVAIQGAFGRHMQDFPVSTSLERILDTFSRTAESDLLCKNDNLLIPMIGYMNKTWKGIDSLSKHTLKSIGIDQGKALFRYSQIQITPEELEMMRQRNIEEEAQRTALMQLYSQNKAKNEERERLNQRYEREVEEREQLRIKEMLAKETAEKEEEMEIQVSNAAEPTSRLNQLQNALNVVSASLNDGAPADNLLDQMMRDDGRLKIGEHLSIQPKELFDSAQFKDFKFPEVPVATFGDLMIAEANGKLSSMIKTADRRAVLFERVKKETCIEEEISDDFYELTVAEAKKMQRELGEQVKQLTQKALLPKTFVEQQNRQKKIQAYKHTVIRIRIEENLFVQARFLSVEPVDRLFDFVASILDPNAPKFSLSIVHEKLEKGKGQDLLDADLAPVATVMIHFDGIRSSKTLLNAGGALQECTSEEADSISREWLSANSTFQYEVYTVAPEPETQVKKRNREEPEPSSSSNESRRSTSTSNDPMPKWFKRH